MTAAGFDLALHTVGYEWTVRPHGFDGADVLAHLASVQAEATEVALADLELPRLYPRLVRLTALSFAALATLPAPSDIEGLDGFQGLQEWMRGLSSPD